MVIFQTSADVLNLSLAISVLGLAFLLSWILVYFIMIVRRLVNVLRGIEQSLAKLESFFSAAKDKIENSASYLSVVALGIKELMRYLIERREEKTGGKKRTGKS
ncbi:MAG: hypothetical protein HY974_02545 [Candidatus Kerfeldbacteria bacterium]|nr:hypothetical protein [Candidatus Kerfeldbacteria bacterium]